jgi:hypothetical protein
LLSLNLTKAPPLDLEVRRELNEVFRQDSLQLQELIGRDLSGWLQVENRTADRGLLTK